jgi:hypothetical protein
MAPVDVKLAFCRVSIITAVVLAVCKPNAPEASAVSVSPEVEALIKVVMEKSPKLRLHRLQG